MMWAIATLVASSVVCLSVYVLGTSVSHAKVAELIEIPFWEQTWMNSNDDDDDDVSGTSRQQKTS